MDGNIFRFVSGSFHFWRQFPQQWEETILKMKNGGLNAIQTYVPWNLVEPEKGKYVFDKLTDLNRFLNLCEQNGMWVILRPGPYICGEIDNGGVPAWLYKENGIRPRSTDPKFFESAS